MKAIATLASAFIMLTATTAGAQSWDLSAMGGYVLPVALDHAARGVDETSIGGGFTWQFAAGHTFGTRWGVEGSWSDQVSSYQVEGNGETGTLFAMHVMQFQGNVLYHFGKADSRVQPFAIAGLGATIFTARDLQSEAKTSISVGGGLKMFFSNAVGLRAQARYRPTFLVDTDATNYCDPFGFCQSTLNQFDFAAGVTFRF